MKGKISVLLTAIVIFACVLALFGCKPVDGTNGKDGAEGKSAYELYKQNYPDYDGDEKQWLEDMAQGKLASSRSYDVISYGSRFNASILQGEANSDGSAMTLNNCVAQLNSPVILPTSSKSNWQIKISGALSSNDSSVQLLSSSAYGENGRVYLGANASQNKVYLGVNIGGTYLNYCWGVASSAIKGDHDYVIAYDDGEYLLKIDEGNFYPFETVNYNHVNNADVSDSEQASSDFNQKIKALFGQDYIVLTSVGAKGFALNSQLSYIRVETSSIYGYDNLACHPLKGVTIYHLGSSISYGHANSGTSFAEQIRDVTGSKMVKQTVSGTTLSNQKDNSYAVRWSNFTFADNPAYLILQLSTNDFAQSGVTIGEASGKDKTDNFVPNTTASAIEYIIAQTKEKSPDTKIIVYTCVVKQTWANAHPQYGEFVDSRLKAIAQKWQVTVVDLYNSDTLFNGILADDIHPNSAGYATLFTPKLIDAMLSARA